MACYFIQKVTLKSGDIRYRARIKHQSRSFRSKTFKLRKDAVEWSAKYISDLENFRHAGREPCQITFAQLATQYLSQWQGKDAIRVSLVERLADYFGNAIINKITTNDCRELMQMWDDKANSTYNKYKAILVALFDFAIRQNEESARTYIEHNPARKIRSKPINNLRVRYLSDDEKRRLVKACRDIGGKFYLAFLLALTTGLRKSNVFNLRWSDVDFHRGLLSVGVTKNGEPIMAPVPGVVFDLLRKYREIGNGLIFESDIVSGIPNGYKKQWIKARKMADIENFRWHDLRHDTASTLARDGRTLLEIAEVLGHRSLQSTKRYAHLSIHHKQQVLTETMTKTLDGLL